MENLLNLLLLSLVILQDGSSDTISMQLGWKFRVAASRYTVIRCVCCILKALNCVSQESLFIIS